MSEGSFSHAAAYIPHERACSISQMFIISLLLGATANPPLDL